MPATESTQLLGLDRALRGQPCQIIAVDPPTYAPEWRQWQDDMGFLPGETVTVQARNALGRRPDGGARGLVHLCPAPG